MRPRYFDARLVDDDPRLLAETYRLRYQVYCLERAFIRPEDYPDQHETDEFDPHSLHVGSIDLRGEVAATARMVQASRAGFPLLGHCTISADTLSLSRSGNSIIEVSRLAVSRLYRRREGDGHYAVQGPRPHPGQERRAGGELMVSVYKALYQVSKRRGFTHWLAATEPSLQRLLSRYGFPLRAIGPEVDYFGRVSPYLMDLAEFDQVILSHRIAALDEFMVGLEPEFSPAPASEAVLSCTP